MKNIAVEARENWALLAMNVMAEAVAGGAFMKGVSVPKAKKAQGTAFMARTIMMRTTRAANHRAETIAPGGVVMVMRAIGMTGMTVANAVRLFVPPVPLCERRCTRGGDRAVRVGALEGISEPDLAAAISGAGISGVARSAPMDRSVPMVLLVRAARSEMMAPLAAVAVDADAAAGGGASGLTARSCGSSC